MPETIPATMPGRDPADGDRRDHAEQVQQHREADAPVVDEEPDAR